MKKLVIYFLLFYIIQSSTVNGQDFPGRDVELLFGSEIKVKEKNSSSQEYGYRDFYLDKKLNKIYSKISGSGGTKYESLVNKEFVVIGIDSLRVDKLYSDYILTIKNQEIGIIYYKYQGDNKYGFPFEVIGGLKYPDHYFCKFITEEKDKFNGKTTFRSPVLDDVSFVRVIDEKNSTVYMSLDSYGNTLNLNAAGVIVLLKDSSKLEFISEKINVKSDGRYQNSSSTRYKYSAFIRLNEQDIERLKESEITDYRLYIYDRSIKNGKLYQEYLKCILTNEIIIANEVK